MSSYFHGSYRSNDVIFLLKPIVIDLIQDLQQKEKLIQTGQKHYSEMLSPESPPSPHYLELFQTAYNANCEKMAEDCLILAHRILANKSSPCIISLARAGTPVGVIIKHILETITQKTIPHFCISIIRDRGVDTNALTFIQKQGFLPENWVFVDGWTGKGVISDELEQSISQYNQHYHCHADAGLYVLADLAGKARVAASNDDYLIPSCILNSTISGLISRTILNDSIGENDFHGCMYFEELKPHDLSIIFVDNIVKLAIEKYHSNVIQHNVFTNNSMQEKISQQFIQEEMQRYHISHRNLIKPGIGESTRVLLRRVPERLVVRSLTDASVQHLLSLAQQKAVCIEERPDLLFKAFSIVRSHSDA